jgi:DnaJ-class molecular chaperone
LYLVGGKMRDPYSILGVRRDAGSDEIKAAWRSKAKTSHPDQNRDDPSATQRFAEIGQAYDVLKDKDKRSRYDQRLSQMESMKREQTIMQQREEARAAAERARQAKANAERIMADLARIEAEKAKAEKAAEALNAKVEAARAKAKAAEAQAATAAKAQQTTAQQAASAQPNGAQQNGPQPTNTAQPNGSQQASGAAAPDPAAPADVEDIATSDTAKDTADSPFAPKPDGGAAEPAQTGIFALPVIGLITSLLVRRIRKPAPVLEKAPDIMVEATIAIDDLLQQNTISLHLSDGRDIRLPLEPGHTDGTIVRMEGKGLKIPGMLTGDVLATLRVLKAGPCTIDGYDIRCPLKLPLEDAVLGCETTVDGPSGPVKITVPAWSGSEQSIRLENQGLPIGGNERGALVVDIRVVLSEKPNEKLTDLMKVMKHGLFL